MIYHLHVPINSKTRLFCMHSIITSTHTPPIYHTTHPIGASRIVLYLICMYHCISFVLLLYSCFNIQLHDVWLQNAINECMSPRLLCVTPPNFKSWIRPWTWCRVFHSRVFHPCYLVPRFPLRRFPPLQFWWCRVFHSRVFSQPV